MLKTMPDYLLSYLTSGGIFQYNKKAQVANLWIHVTANSMHLSDLIGRSLSDEILRERLLRWAEEDPDIKAVLVRREL